jgi:2-polyprenyl-3-methyl-5-hydroxy-6-metoxy-1,4-benzoquinol methylase
MFVRIQPRRPYFGPARSHGITVTTDNARFLGTIPELYDQHLGPVIFAPFAEDLARTLAPRIQGAVLELACGTGILTEQLRLGLAPGQALMATDLNQPMIDYAREKLRGLNSIEWRQADAQVVAICGWNVRRRCVPVRLHVRA